MQAEQTVTFQPMFVDNPMPWFVKLFALYLACVLLAAITRSVRLAWALRTPRKTQDSGASDADSLIFWELSQARVRSFKNSAVLTFLLSTLVTAITTIDVLAGITTAKSPSLGFFAAELAEVLVTFSIGILVCAISFSCAVFFERLLLRRRLAQYRDPGKP